MFHLLIWTFVYNDIDKKIKMISEKAAKFKSCTY